MSTFTGMMFILCAIVAVGITEGTPALDLTWALIFFPATLGMIFFGLVTVVLANNEVDNS